VKIDGEVVLCLTQPPAERDIRKEPFETSRTRCNDDLVEVAVMADHGSGGRLDDVGEVCVREAAPEGMNGRRRENDVADLPEADQKNASR